MAPAPNSIIRRETVEAKGRWSVRLEPGQTLKMIDTMGQQAIDFLVDRVGHERRNATAEVRRSVNGSYSPLYQAAYLLGGLQLRSLHAELVPGRMTDGPLAPPVPSWLTVKPPPGPAQ